jgi:hypothetical protein
MRERISVNCSKTANSIGAAVVLAGFLLSAPTWAQTTTPAPQPAEPPPATMPDSPRTVPEQIAPPAAPSVVGSASTPSVVVPKPIDPGIQVPVKTPTNDKMPVVKPPAAPVVKPPAAPDANTTVVPK